VGARCVNRARRDLCGGCSAMGIPTASIGRELISVGYGEHLRMPRPHFSWCLRGSVFKGQGRGEQQRIVGACASLSRQPATVHSYSTIELWARAVRLGAWLIS